MYTHDYSTYSRVLLLYHLLNSFWQVFFNKHREYVINLPCVKKAWRNRGALRWGSVANTHLAHFCKKKDRYVSSERRGEGGGRGRGSDHQSVDIYPPSIPSIQFPHLQVYLLLIRMSQQPSKGSKGSFSRCGKKGGASSIGGVCKKGEGSGIAL